MEEINHAIIEFLKVIADESRLAIIEFIKDKRRTPAEIQIALNKSPTRVYQNLKALSQAGIIAFDQEGIKKTYYIKDPQIFKIISQILSYISKESDEKKEFIRSLDMMDIFF
jgi:DNA-binding transcriptional ArsR family regulator